jgi:hypothetical protein
LVRLRHRNITAKEAARNHYVESVRSVIRDDECLSRYRLIGSELTLRQLHFVCGVARHDRHCGE